MRNLTLLLLTCGLMFSCHPKCNTCPGGKMNKVQKQAIKMEKKLNRQARKENKK